jgi:hypothetical protein
MTGFYDRMAATADRLLKKYGAARELHRTTADSYDPSTGVFTPGGDVTYDIFAAKFDYEQKDIDGTVIKAGDQRAYISPTAAVTPQTGDRIDFDGVKWNVQASRPIAPATKIVLHDVQLRR